MFSFSNKGVWALKFTLMLHFEFVAQAVPHQCIAHHGAEHRAAAAAEKTTASASPSRRKRVTKQTVDTELSGVEGKGPCV